MDLVHFCPECGARLSNDQVPPAGQPKPAAIREKVAVPRNRAFDLLAQQRAPFWLALLAAVVMVIGALGSWATALNVVSISGTRGDGWLVIAAATIGVAGLWGCVRRRSMALGLLAVICGLGGAAVSAIDLHKITSVKSASFLGQQLNLVQPGWGLYADVGASVIFCAVVGALLIWWRPTSTPDATAQRMRSMTVQAPVYAHPGRHSFQPNDAPTIGWSPMPSTPSGGGPPNSDRGMLIGLGIAACLILVALVVGLYVGGVFNSTASTQASQLVSSPASNSGSSVTTTAPTITAPTPTAPTPTTPTAPAPTAPTPAVPAQQTSTSTSQPRPAQGPASALRSHLEDINSGDYRAAFRLMSASYQAQNPSWPSDRTAANPGVNIISIGAPQYQSGGAQVPVEFYARDRNSTPGSDTQCRDFQGRAKLISSPEGWRYDPSGNSLTATVVSSSNPNCPS